MELCCSIYCHIEYNSPQLLVVGYPSVGCPSVVRPSFFSLNTVENVPFSFGPKKHLGLHK